jgi:hypothetical protein
MLVVAVDHLGPELLVLAVLVAVVLVEKLELLL